MATDPSDPYDPYHPPITPKQMLGFINRVMSGRQKHVSRAQLDALINATLTLMVEKKKSQQWVMEMLAMLGPGLDEDAQAHIRDRIRDLESL